MDGGLSGGRTATLAGPAPAGSAAGPATGSTARELIAAGRREVAAVDEEAKRRQVDAQKREARTRRRGWLILAATLVIALGALGIGAYSLHRQNTERDTRAADVAELAATGQVASARASSLACARGTLPLPAGCDPSAPSLRGVNDMLSAAGLPPVPDPGPSANAYQIAMSAGAGLGEIRALAELRKRGVVLPGVRLPDASGRFPAGR